MNFTISQDPNIQTILPSLFRPAPHFKYERETLETNDGDFLDLDWYNNQATKQKLAIILYGLEGTSKNPYVKNAVFALQSIGYNALTMNFRGCSGKANKLLHSYHSGKTEDLELVINHVLNKYEYPEIVLIGYSIGGNMVLKYLGEKSTAVNPRIKKSVSFSAPVDLKSAADALARPCGVIYMKYLLKKLQLKLLQKQKLFPGMIDLSGFDKIKTFHEFDRKYTAPMNGFKDELDYWQKASSKPLLTKIAIPSLLITAKDDPFLGPACYPIDEAKANPNLKLLITEKGGHVGFWKLEFKGIVPKVDFYHEKYMLEFLS